MLFVWIKFNCFLAFFTKSDYFFDFQFASFQNGISSKKKNLLFPLKVPPIIKGSKNENDRVASLKLLIKQMFIEFCVSLVCSL